MLPDIKKNSNLEGRRVLVRADFNVPMRNGGVSAGAEWRLKAVLPTLDFLKQSGAKIIILSHLGRPEGQDFNFSLYPVFTKLKELWPGADLSFSHDILGPSAENQIGQLKNGQAILLENLRFYKEEEENDLEFSKKLSQMGDIFVNDAFAASHRAHASIVGIPKFLESYAGLLLQKEISVLSAVREKPRRPLALVLGGAKADTKLKLVREFLDKADQIILGGVLANTVFCAQGLGVGKSLLENNLIEEAKKLDLSSKRLHLPVDVLVSKSLEVARDIAIRPVGQIKPDEFIVDIGPETSQLFQKIIQGARMIIWNGSLGLVEVPSFKENSVALARAIAQNSGEKIVGGGDLISFLSGENILDKMSYVSTGGGAMLEFLAGDKLPGIEVLEK